nr:uncharacterized protein LOC133603018 [Nerophis lumbriciformis]
MAYFALVLVIMTWVTVTASLDRNVLTAAAEIWADPWGKATLFDAYLAFLTVYLWIAYREASWPKQSIEEIRVLLIDRLLERDLLPDQAIRFGIRRLLAGRLRSAAAGGEEASARRLEELIAELDESPIALATHTANEQHYELPTEFFQLVLGHQLKYSSALYPTGGESLDQAESAMLDLYVERAQIADGQRILELGCGWGSLTFRLAEGFPGSSIVAVSNSSSQREFLQAEAEKRGVENLQVITADMRDFEAPGRFDRVVSIEMFEHMRNYRWLMARVAGWLEPAGKLFVHIFCHRTYAYPFEDLGPGDWMARYFFTGGLMPSYDLLTRFQDDLRLAERWQVDGTHYERTSLHWLANMDRHKAEILPIFERTYGAAEVKRWWVYWRVFFLSCAELFGYHGGREWLVGHYLFEKAS